jgi:hypothetical protein
MSEQQRNIRVTAWLSSPLAGDPPMLDALLEDQMARHHGQLLRIDRGAPPPQPGSIHLPMLRGAIGPLDLIPRCSSPVIPSDKARHEHYAKRIAVEEADMLRDDSRLVVATTNSWTKAYRLPLDVRQIDRVVWFVGGTKRKTLHSLLRRITAIGRKRSQGFGRIAKWTYDYTEGDYSWFAPHAGQLILMRPLPYCPELPANLAGYRRDFAACLSPYWHPHRFTEVVLPC